MSTTHCTPLARRSKKGILPGGGVALFGAAKAPDNVQTDNADQRYGAADQRYGARSCAAPFVGSVPPPTHPAGEFLAYETECLEALKSLLAGLLDTAESAGRDRKTAAPAPMFPSALQVQKKPISQCVPAN